jgi:hypothetical protein
MWLVRTDVSMDRITIISVESSLILSTLMMEAI